ncbi:hypothetical protein AWH63_11185 [Marinobacter sp. C18]|uniref:hypothetical protein n=1 Tax=Marinobacter sp. C18 TaxID=1772288 RepID=UPI000948944A|nr:hypothetical protein [Marinobacter sp. C18]OLF82096.1 hypothetical protein AWH63_11185 [Marinobacter sp. C18]
MRKVYGSDWPPGTVIRMYEEILRIRKNWGSNGEVEDMAGEPVSSKYYWEFQGDRAVVLSRPDRG